jgi:uncharacterized membrane protein YraQ (UPF0718 family)
LSRIYHDVATLFLSIVVEALPFLLLGVFVSALIEVFVSKDLITSLLPKNPLLALPVAGLAGIVFPVCECGIVPITRRLHGKGVPLGPAITFMLAAPIVNPIVALSTRYAFGSTVNMVALRLGFGFLAATLIGLVIHLTVKKNILKDSPGHHHHHHSHGSKLSQVVGAACGEFFGMSRFLLLGALLAASVQAVVSRPLLLAIGQGRVGSVAAMMTFGYLISLCSEADAFVASTFTGTFTTGSLLAFLLYGPMTDVKNTLMMFAAFKSKFVLWLLVLITVVILTIGVSVNLLGVV